MLDANIAYYWRENPAPSFTNDSTQLPVLPKARQWDLRLRSNWTEEAGQVHFLWVKLPNPYLLGWIGGFRHLERVFFYHEQARHLPSEWGFWVDVEEHWNRVWTSGRCKWCSRTRRRVRRSTDACSFLRIQMTLWIVYLEQPKCQVHVHQVPTLEQVDIISFCLDNAGISYTRRYERSFGSCSRIHR